MRTLNNARSIKIEILIEKGDVRVNSCDFKIVDKLYVQMLTKKYSRRLVICMSSDCHLNVHVLRMPMYTTV